MRYCTAGMHKPRVSGRQVNKFYTVMPSLCGSAVWNALVILRAPKILRPLLFFGGGVCFRVLMFLNKQCFAKKKNCQ